jgi:hypothetical protein
MAHFTQTIMIMIAISVLTAVWHINQNRAEGSACGGPRKGRQRSDLFSVESLAQEVRLGGSRIPHLLQLNYSRLILFLHSSDAQPLKAFL